MVALLGFGGRAGRTTAQDLPKGVDLALGPVVQGVGPLSEPPCSCSSYATPAAESVTLLPTHRCAYIPSHRPTLCRGDRIMSAFTTLRRMTL